MSIAKEASHILCFTKHISCLYFHLLHWSYLVLNSKNYNEVILPSLRTLIFLQGLATLLAVKTEMYDQRFELQINDIRFIGHPIVMDCSKENSLQMCHLAFVINVSTMMFILHCYYNMTPLN